ncbi:MAG: hypothetical protein ACLSF7_01195 [Acutalibacteraceae bacterium]
MGRKNKNGAKRDCTFCAVFSLKVNWIGSVTLCGLIAEEACNPLADLEEEGGDPCEEAGDAALLYVSAWKIQ